MSQQYYHGSHHSQYNFLTQQSATPVSEPQSNGVPQPTLPPAYSLPPLSASNYATANSHHGFLPRQPFLMTSQAETANQPGAVPVYAPTANLYLGQNHTTGTSSPPAYTPTQHAQASEQYPMHMRSQSQMGTPGTATARNLQEIAPMPARSDEDALSTYAKGQPAPQPEEPVRPAHVVGAQGRRGILPSAAGRPPAPVGEELNDQKAVIIPPKDADGKYPCIHCDKTYLHAKHLKRHLLRHTGVRPYICGLCNDSFSRSDILKRHFNKCSARRGNPTGQSHLTHSRASKLKEKQEQQEAAIAAARDSQAANIPQSINGAHMMNGVQIPNAAQLAGYPPTSMDPQFDISSLTLNQSNSGGASNQVSRANSVTHGTRNTGSESQRTSFGMISPSGYDSAGYAQSTGHVTPDSITTSGAATPYTYPHESRTNQLSDNATFTQSPNGDPSFSASSRPAASSIYGFGPLPQIVNNENGRGYAATWPQPSLYGLHDDYESLHQSGTNPSAEPQPPKPMTLSHRTHNRS